MSIASEITRLQQAKADIKTAIEDKGVTVSSSAKLDDYADLIDTIESGGNLNDIFTKENLTNISISIDGQQYTLNSTNNFVDDNYILLTLFKVESISLTFNDTFVNYRPAVYLAGSHGLSDGHTYTYISIGGNNFDIKRDDLTIYLYLNNEVIGTIYASD